MSIKRNLPIALAIAVALSLISFQAVVALGGKCLDQTGCACCPVCDHVCKLDAEQVEEEKSCFKVESKVICIPRVVFPWQKAKKAACASCDACDGAGCTNCVHNGARLRKVCVLKTEKYKCPACKYTWTAEKKDSCCGVPGACDATNVCDSGCAAGPVIVHDSVATPAVDAADYYKGSGQPVPPPTPMPPAPVPQAN